MRDVLSDGIRRVGGGWGARLSGCVWLEVIQRSRRGGRPPLPAPVSNEMHTEAGGERALGAGGVAGFSGGHSPVLSLPL